MGDKQAQPDAVATTAVGDQGLRQRDSLFFAALAAVRHHADASEEALQARLGVERSYAEKLLADLEAEGFVTAPYLVEGDLKRDLIVQKPEEDWLTHDGLAREERRSQKVQKALLRRHPARAGIQQVAKLVEDEIVAILSAYQKAGLIEIRRHEQQDNALLEIRMRREIGFSVGSTVAEALASEQDWPNGSREILSHQDQLTLFRDELSRAVKCDELCNHYSRHSQPAHVPDGDLVERPGWDHRWLSERLYQVGVFQNSAYGRYALHGIRYVVIKKDGSGAIVTEDGAVKKF
jgi:hypothetical protein